MIFKRLSSERASTPQNQLQKDGGCGLLLPWGRSHEGKGYKSGCPVKLAPTAGEQDGS